MYNSKLNKIANSKIFMFLLFGIIILSFSLRVLYLDRDLPPWGIGYYQPIDEGSYSILALNSINHDTINPSNLEGGLTSVTPSHVRTNIIGNIATYIGLNSIGDNYYGLRLPYVCICFINFILIAAILFHLRKKYGARNVSEIWIILGGLLYLTIDFPFTLASRVVEPSTVRLLFVLLSVLLFLKLEGKNRIKNFCVGFIITLSIFAIYITNIFLVLAMGIVLLYQWKQEGFKKFLRYTCFFTLGCLVALGFCEIYYLVFWNTEAIMNMLSVRSTFSSVSGYSGARSILSFGKIAISFFTSNELLYNIPILFCFIITLPLVIRRLKLKKDINLLFILSIILSFFLQTLASEDYIIRKSIVTYPILLFIIYLGYLFINDYGIANIFINKKVKELQEASMSFPNLKIIKRMERLLSKVDFYGIGQFVVIFVTVLILSLYLTNLSNINKNADYSSIDKLIFFICTMSPIIIIIFNFIWRLLRKNKNKIKSYIILFVILFGFTSFNNFYFDLKYLYLNPTFSDRNVMMELKKDAGDNYVLGEYENGFTLYNNIQPVLNSYEQLKKYMDKNNNLLYFDYYDNYDPGMRAFFDNLLFEKSEFTVIPVKVYTREFQVGGVKRKMALYRVVTKYNAGMHYLTYYNELAKKKKLNDEEEEIFKKLKVIVGHE